MPIFTPISYTANTKIKSADVNGNFTAIANIFNNTNQIPRNVLATGTANAVVTNDGSGFLGAGIAPSTSGNVLTSTGTTWASSAPSTAPTQPNELYNIGLSCSVGSSALTINLKQSDATTDPAVGSNTKITFRSATLASGAAVERAITSALSIVVPATATLGSASGTNFYVYVYALDNVGTVELAVSGTKYDSNALQSTTTIAAASNTVTTIYSTTGRSGVPVRLIGRLLVNEATAGTWASLPTEILLTPTLRPLPTVQVFTSGSGTYTTPSTASYLRLRMAGGGGGGGSNTGSTVTGGSGGNTTFGSGTAGGGGGGTYGNQLAGANGGTAALDTGWVGVAIPGTQGGAGNNGTNSQNGGNGGTNAFGGGASISQGGQTGLSGVANTGGGGSGAGINSGGGGNGGGGGGYVDAIIVNPAATYSYAVGAGGSGGVSGGSGAAGIIIVEEYYT